MNVTCHSSFETNLRVSGVPPSGRKDTPADKKSPGPPPAVPWGPAATFDIAERGPQPRPVAGGNSGLVPADPESRPAAYDAGLTNPNLSPYIPLPPGYDQPDHLLFTGNGELGFFSGWDFDFSLLPVPSIPFQPQPDSQGIYLDQALVQTGSVPDTSEESTDPRSHPPQQTPNLGPTKEWEPRRRKRQRALPLRKGEPVPETLHDDTFYLDYYAGCIAGAFTIKLDGGRWSYHRFIHDSIQAAPAGCPFRLAVLAWTARQFVVASNTGDIPPSADAAWHAYYIRADAAMAALKASGTDWKLPARPAATAAGPGVNTVAETVICTTLFLCRADVLDGNVSAAAARLAGLAQELGAQRHEHPLHLSAFASKVLLWLCYLHVRISIFSPAPAGETLLTVISRRADYAAVLACSHGYLSEIFGAAYPAADRAEDAARVPASTRLHGVFVLMAAILSFRAHGVANEARRTAAAAIEAGIRRLDNEFAAAHATDPEAAVLRTTAPSRPPAARGRAGTEGGTAPPSPDRKTRPSTSPGRNGTKARPADRTEAPAPAAATPGASPVSRGTLHWLTAHTAFQTAKILWARIAYPESPPGTPPPPPSPPSVDPGAAVQAILATALRLRRAGCAPARLLRSLLWPLPLFAAAVEAADEIHADWAAGFVADVAGGGGQSGGAGGPRVLELMARVRDRQAALGRRVAVDEVVAEMGGAGGAFVF